MLSQDEYNYVVDGQSTVGDMNELENIDEVTDDGNTKFSGEEEYINTDGDDMEDNYNPEEEYKSPVILTKAEYIPTTQLTQQNPNSQIQTVKPKKEKQIPNVPIQINPQNTTVNQTNQVTAGFTGVNVPLRKSQLHNLKLKLKFNIESQLHNLKLKSMKMKKKKKINRKQKVIPK